MKKSARRRASLCLDLLPLAPGCRNVKIENAITRQVPKQRSQFRLAQAEFIVAGLFHVDRVVHKDAAVAVDAKQRLRILLSQHMVNEVVFNNRFSSGFRVFDCGIAAFVGSSVLSSGHATTTDKEKEHRNWQ